MDSQVTMDEPRVLPKDEPRPVPKDEPRAVPKDEPRAVPKDEPRVLRLFISYASEDLNIALAIAQALSDALPEGFAEVCLDKWFLQAGAEVKRGIESKLEKTDFLIIVYTGVSKQSHSFSGWEVGYFERVRKNDSTRRVIPLFLEDMPFSVAEFEGYSLKMSRELLKLSVEQFNCQNDISDDDPMCILVGELQEKANRIREDAGYPKARHNVQNPAAAVKAMRLAIFRYLKTTVEAVLKPQKQITIKTTGSALRGSETDLPLDAKLIPMGGNPMSIFGLGDEEVTWERFLQLTSGSHEDSWREAITSVITSSQAERIDVDNSQIILSSDESKTYRIVLTTATKYWDDNREFNLYFVQSLAREDYGDKDTTSLLKGLELTCRFRFMFLENGSQFAANNLLATSEERLPDMAAKLLRELNLLRNEARSLGIDEPHLWSHFVDWSLILELAEVYGPKEAVIRELIARIFSARGQKDLLIALRKELSKAVGQLADATRADNTRLIESMAKRLLAMVQDSSPTSR
jgi:hypothetical protein